MSDPIVNPSTAGMTKVSSQPVKPQQLMTQTGRRRRFFLLTLLWSWFAVGWTVLITWLLAIVLGTLRFLFPNVLSEPPSQFKAGSPAQYEPETVDTRYKDSQHTWIVRHHSEAEGDIIFALDATCTHLGCTPNWLGSARKFKCPCHGSGFYISGVNFEGPAPRPLERVAIRIGENGQLQVDKSTHFRKELGQWADPASFIKV